MSTTRPKIACGQQLVWQLEATRSNGFFVLLEVDAMTGAVTVLGSG